MEQAEHLNNLRKKIEDRRPAQAHRRIGSLGRYETVDARSSYGTYNAPTGHFGERFQWNCHSGIRNPGSVTFLWSQLGDIGTTTLPQQGPEEEYLEIISEHQRAFLEWFLRESPWSPVVDEFNPDIDWTIKHGIIFGNIDTLPANFVFNAVCASRFPTEFRLACRMWHEMVKAGACPRVAFALTTIQGWNRGQGHDNAHSALSSGFITPKHRYENFVRVGIPDMRGLPSTEGGYSTPSNIIWDDPAGGAPDVTLSGLIGRTYPEWQSLNNENLIEIAVAETKRLKG